MCGGTFTKRLKTHPSRMRMMMMLMMMGFTPETLLNIVTNGLLRSGGGATSGMSFVYEVILWPVFWDSQWGKPASYCCNWFREFIKTCGLDIVVVEDQSAPPWLETDHLLGLANLARNVMNDWAWLLWLSGGHFGVGQKDDWIWRPQNGWTEWIWPHLVGFGESLGQSALRFDASSLESLQFRGI